jgi:stage II sporulation protein D
VNRRALAAGVVVALLGAGLVAGVLTRGESEQRTIVDAVVAKRGQTYYVPVTQELTVRGRGYGHGHGMSQYGAQGAALAGKSHGKILKFYYPGTRFGTNKGLIRVLITADTTSDVAVEPVKGLAVRDLGADTPMVVPELAGVTQWRLTPSAADATRTVVQYRKSKGWRRWRTLVGDGQFVADVPLTLVLPDGTKRRYRGMLRAASPYPGAEVRDTVNVLSMDEYVQGVIADEMPASWHQQALRSQAVAARTYASYAQKAAADRYYQICDTTSCQVYGGVGAETRTTNRAVRKTAGRILLADGRPAFTQFSSSSGGWTSDGGQPYLPAKKDPWDGWEGNANHTWTATISAASLESAFSQLGRLEAVRVTQRDGHGAWGGRVQQVVLEGSADTVVLTGDDIRWRYGLRSSWFTFEPTPIMKTWRELGGRRSMLGAPTSAEVPVEGSTGTGARQLFEKGRAFWTRRHGAAAVAGPVLGRYRKLGGPESEFGYPRKTVVQAADGVGSKLLLERGVIFHSPGTGAWIVHGRILREYKIRKYAGGPLGYPVANVEVTGSVLRGRFQGGTITYDKRSKKVTVKRRNGS